MKKQLLKYLNIIMAGAVLATIPSCKKALDLTPQDAVTDATFWKQATEFKLAANGFYNYLRSFSNGNGDGHGGSDLGADRGALARGTNTVVANDNNYNDAYKWIRNCNYLLAKAKEYSKPEEIKQYVAEAKFFRAYIYFDKLLTSYGGVILVKDLIGLDAPETTAARSSREETIDFIIQDLEAAIADLPSEGAIGAGDKGRVSKEAAQAFLGRVALYEGTWQKFRNGNATRYNALLDKAITNSKAVIESNQFALFKPAVLGDSALKYLFILENQKSNPANITKAANKEYILAVRYESNNLLKTIPGQISFGAIGADMSRKMADLYLCNDGLPINKTKTAFSRATLTSEYQNRDNRMRYYMCIPGYPYWQNATNWHINWDWSPVDLANARPPHDEWSNGTTGYGNQQWAAERQVPNSQEGYDFPVIRLAEVFLNYAEAVYERNGSISDADLDKSLNLVRNRINAAMPKLSNDLVTVNGLDMREEIRRERAVELQGEGFRMDDLKRWYIAHIELNKPMLGVHWTGTEYETIYSYTGTGTPPAGIKKRPGITLDANGDVVTDPASERKFTEKNYLIPIPTNQMQLNPNLVQNPGWQ
ncbi:RagB/SusD family nutrient uptake outer membrane protein [Chitinophagaceae bacterium LB-8]|uniref:RagB/SusD family nutrient uptake outer membrane protein n=1 Tax=Paraflavisolibacter caeni TaxID=2982496 RepID=A0A9X2XZX2_9BACT|nr:RagB/SusD family nutrient uptake outer membrane protein [Paraflavisolibacter caeni]MCU7552739.1 RagB/SusD family nutrient uptake outer membrane protein [Paraflavisolibacter caeni]